MPYPIRSYPTASLILHRLDAWIPLQVRGDVGDDSSESSLEEQTFADMERLMEELDDAAVSSAETAPG